MIMFLLLMKLIMTKDMYVSFLFTFCFAIILKINRKSSLGVFKCFHLFHKGSYEPKQFTELKCPESTLSLAAF